MSEFERGVVAGKFAAIDRIKQLVCEVRIIKHSENAPAIEPIDADVLAAILASIRDYEDAANRFHSWG